MSGVGSKRSQDPSSVIVEKHKHSKRAVWASLAASVAQQRAALGHAVAALADKASAAVGASGGGALAKLEELLDEARKVQQELDDERRSCLAQALRDEATVVGLHTAHKVALAKATEELNKANKAATSAETAAVDAAVDKATQAFSADIERPGEEARAELKKLMAMAESLT
jgi:hypothetical protein